MFNCVNRQTSPPALVQHSFQLVQCVGLSDPRLVKSAQLQMVGCDIVQWFVLLGREKAVV